MRTEATAGGGMIAIDWGTTNRRVYLMDARGGVLASERDNRGVKAMAEQDYRAEIAALRARFGALPVIAAGMVGSTRGMQEAPYVAAPADLAALAAALMPVTGVEAMGIVPGVSCVAGHHADVMRGEEVQVLGAVEAGLAPADALFCQPGTHNKWIELRDARIVRFATAMTGELFALLRDHSILAEMMGGSVEDGPAFRAGVEASGAGPLLEQIFGVRAAVLLGLRDRADAAAFLSGLLIGADVRGQGIAGRRVHLLADAGLGALYASAISLLGGASLFIDSHAAFAAGIHAIRDQAYV